MPGELERARAQSIGGGRLTAPLLAGALAQGGVGLRPDDLLSPLASPLLSPLASPDDLSPSLSPGGQSGQAKDGAAVLGSFGALNGRASERTSGKLASSGGALQGPQEDTPEAVEAEAETANGGGGGEGFGALEWLGRVVSLTVGSARLSELGAEGLRNLPHLKTASFPDNNLGGVTQLLSPLV